MSIRTVPIILVGFGNAARRLAELLIERAYQIEDRYHVRFICTAIATARHGSVVSSAGLDLTAALTRVRNGDSLVGLMGAQPVADAFVAIERSRAEILIETTTLNIEDGEPACSHIRHALNLGKHVLTANKGPLAFAAQQLRALARERNLSLRYESTVMDGAPIFNLVERTLPLVQINKLRGIVNSTTNFILTAMETGRSYQSALAEAQARGIAEADASLDVDGWDAAVKATVLANCLMGANLLPTAVVRTGIGELSTDQLVAARLAGKKIRLVTTVIRSDSEVKASVAPEEIASEDLLYFIDEYSNVLIFETDLMGTIALVEQQPDLTQTAYGLLSDLLAILPSLN
ncbi:MAG: homoserine dehydrogenase [Acidobacteriota bacterium]